MSEWDFNESGSSSGNSARYTTGGLNSAMSIVCLLVVAGVSFLMAWLMKDVVRSFWQMGLTFAAPFAALMFSSLMVERNTHLMTPSTSIGPQRWFALATIVVAFAVGCLTVLLHEPVKIMVGQYDYVLAIDKSWSMNGERDRKCQEAVNKLIDGLSDNTRVSVVVFDDGILDSTDLLPLAADHRNRLSAAVAIRPNGGTKFDPALNEARRIIDQAGDHNRPVRIVLLSDGDGSFFTYKDFIQWAQNAPNKVELSAIQINGRTKNEVRSAVEATGGTIQDEASVDKLGTNLGKVISSGNSEDVDTLKATYNGQTADGKSNTTYKIMSLVMLVLLGLLAGFSLMIMFSSRGQFRVQVILSAAAGVAAFLLLGKTAGGYLGDRLGMKWASVGSLGLAVLGFLFSGSPLCGVLAIFFFNMTMPLTLRAAADALPGMKGFSFGLLTFALFLGFLPAWAGFALPNAGWFLMLGALLSLGLLLPGLRRKP